MLSPGDDPADFTYIVTVYVVHPERVNTTLSGLLNWTRPDAISLSHLHNEEAAGTWKSIGLRHASEARSFNILQEILPPSKHDLYKAHHKG